MEANQLLALAGPLSYFALIIFLFSVIASSLKPKALRSSSRVATVYGALAVISFLHTFTYILLDFEWSYYNYFHNLQYTVVGSPVELMSHWLMNTSIFKESWVYASDGIINWWWLENLCIFTAGTWTVFLVSEGKRKNIPYLWAYMIVSQVVAVSTACCLFFLALTLRAAKPRPIPAKKNDDDINAVISPFEMEPEVGAQTILPVLLSLFTISICPAPTSPDFLPNVLILHALLLIPVLPSPLQTIQPRWLNMPTITVYFAVSALSLTLRLQSTLAAVASLPEIGIWQFATAAFSSLQSHPAMATFGWDTVWTTIAFLVWTALGDGSTNPNLRSLIPTVTSTAALGIAFSAPMALGNVVDEIFTQNDVKETTVT